MSEKKTEANEKPPNLNDGKSTNGKIYVNLEFKNKDIGKKLGCHWDKILTKWYIDNKTDTTIVKQLLNILVENDDGTKERLLTIPRYHICEEDYDEFDKKQLTVHRLKYYKKEEALLLFGKLEIIKKKEIDYKSMFTKK